MALFVEELECRIAEMCAAMEDAPELNPLDVLDVRKLHYMLHPSIGFIQDLSSSLVLQLRASLNNFVSDPFKLRLRQDSSQLRSCTILVNMVFQKFAAKVSETDSTTLLICAFETYVFRLLCRLIIKSLLIPFVKSQHSYQAIQSTITRNLFLKRLRKMLKRNIAFVLNQKMQDYLAQLE